MKLLRFTFTTCVQSSQGIIQHGMPNGGTCRLDQNVERAKGCDCITDQPLEISRSGRVRIARQGHGATPQNRHSSACRMAGAVGYTDDIGVSLCQPRSHTLSRAVVGTCDQRYTAGQIERGQYHRMLSRTGYSTWEIIDTKANLERSAHGADPLQIRNK